MKALTLWQPWASLVAFGVKTIETRSWSTRYRGPLAIHAGARPPEQALRVGGYVVGHWKDEAVLWDWPEGEHWVPTTDGPVFTFSALPLGAVVATCELIDVAPIGEWDSFRTGVVEGDEGDFPDQHVLVRGMDGTALTLDAPSGPNTDVTEQRPFGDFTSGRFGWLLENVVRLHDPVPATGRQGLWTWAP